jgi:hypothetical protein
MHEWTTDRINNDGLFFSWSFYVQLGKLYFSYEYANLHFFIQIFSIQKASLWVSSFSSKFDQLWILYVI